MYTFTQYIHHYCEEFKKSVTYFKFFEIYPWLHDKILYIVAFGILVHPAICPVELNG